MRRQREFIVTAIIMLGLAAVLFTGCGELPDDGSVPGGETETAYPLRLTDDAGREVTIDAKPERIISFGPGHTETLFALGLGGKMVGVDDFSDYPAAAWDIERIGDTVSPNYEKILSLAPDVVFTVGSEETEIVARLDELGVSVVVLQAESVADILDDMLTIGRITATAAAAEELVGNLRAEIEAVAARAVQIPDNERPAVFYEVMPPGQWGMWTAGPGSFIDDMINIAGGKNIAGDVTAAYTTYSEEVLMAKNPAIIITPFPETLAEIGQRPGWETIAAVQNGRVFWVDRDAGSRPGPRIVEALKEIAAAVIPAE